MKAQELLFIVFIIVVKQNCSLRTQTQKWKRYQLLAFFLSTLRKARGLLQSCSKAAGGKKGCVGGTSCLKGSQSRHVWSLTCFPLSSLFPLLKSLRYDFCRVTLQVQKSIFGPEKKKNANQQETETVVSSNQCLICKHIWFKYFRFTLEQVPDAIKFPCPLSLNTSNLSAEVSEVTSLYLCFSHEFIFLSDRMLLFRQGPAV